MRIDAFIRTALAGEKSQVSQSLNPEKENNSQLSTLNSQLKEIKEINPQSSEKVAVQIDTERLKFIDEFSRLILELKKQFPEIAQYLSKARDNVSSNTENIPVKNLMNLLNAVQQNLSAYSKTEKPEIAETIKNLVGEIVKILQPSSESPPEQKLLQALSKNDFASANIAIKNIVETAIAQSPNISQSTVPQSTQNMQPEIRTQQIPLQTLQQIPLQIQQQVPQTVPIAPTPVVQTPTPQTPQAMANIQQTFQAIFNALQELKELGLPKELQNAPLKELETIALQKTGIEIPKDLGKNLSATFGEKPVFAVVNFAPALIRVMPEIPEMAQTPRMAEMTRTQETPHLAHLPQTQETSHLQRMAEIAQTPETPHLARTAEMAQTPEMQHLPRTAEMAQTPETPRLARTAEMAQTPRMPEMAQTPGTPHLPHLPHLLETPGTPEMEMQTGMPLHVEAGQARRPAPAFEIPLPKNFPLKIPHNHKIEMAFSLYQMPNQKNETAFVLQPWVASAQIPREEREVWLKTDLPLTPQTLNIREVILSFGKLPENPEPVRLFASGMHELSLQTEQGANIPKEQINLLWRIVQNPQILQTQMQSLPPQITQTLLKYQPLGNYEGDLFKNLPEPVKRELSQELPAGKTWQPETLQKAVEKVLAKYIEQPQAQMANLNEHASKAHEEIKSALQNLKEQIQWTRIDQDTRLQNDKENVFYFMHGSDLQKGRLKVKDERKGGSKHKQDSSISFSIETKAKNLGNVHADLTLSKNTLTIRLQDELGTAGDAIKEERETLAKELADIGIVLGELLYGKTPKVQNLPIAKKEGKSSGGLDVRA